MHTTTVGRVQGKNLSFFQQKSLRVRRLYDSKRSTVIYIAYSTRLTSAGDEGGASTGRYKCVCFHLPLHYLQSLFWLSPLHAVCALLPRRLSDTLRRASYGAGHLCAPCQCHLSRPASVLHADAGSWRCAALHTLLWAVQSRTF